MEDVDLRHAKEHLEELLERAARGEDVRINDPRLGTIKLTAVAGAGVPTNRPKRVPGLLKDKLPPPPDDFFDPMTEEELKDWYGDEP
jgi:antitoxin (DNA-binding transcriptional repressor) of toxin-antitoxin stability system